MKGEGRVGGILCSISQYRGFCDTCENLTPQPLYYLEQSLGIQQEIGDMAGLCATLFNIGHIHAQNKAISVWLDALAALAPQCLGMPEGLAGWAALAEQLEGE